MKTAFAVLVLLVLALSVNASAQRIGSINVRQVSTHKASPNSGLGLVKTMEATIVALETGPVSIESKWNRTVKIERRIVVGDPAKIQFTNELGRSVSEDVPGWVFVVRNAAGELLGYKAENPAADALFRKREQALTGKAPAGAFGAASKMAGGALDAKPAGTELQAK